MTAEPVVYFFLPHSDRYQDVESFDLDRDWIHMCSGCHAWILQTFMRLKKRGCPVELTEQVPRKGIVIFHNDRTHDFLVGLVPGSRILAVCVTADRPRNSYADIEIFQNGHGINNRTRFFVPHWPQPGLIPRDVSRGETIRTCAYKGAIENIHPDYLSGAWPSFLNEHGVRWICDANVYVDGTPETYTNSNWNDYSEVDLLLAVRPDVDHLHLEKPASKLLNSWRAGVPAILGPEFAYRELRRTHLDYFEVGSVRDAENVVARLMNESRLYNAVVENGLRRYREFTVEKITDIWEDLIFNTIVPRYGTLKSRINMRINIGIKHHVRELLI